MRPEWTGRREPPSGLQHRLVPQIPHQNHTQMMKYSVDAGLLAYCLRLYCHAMSVPQYLAPTESRGEIPMALPTVASR